MNQLGEDQRARGAIRDLLLIPWREARLSRPSEAAGPAMRQNGVACPHRHPGELQ